MATSSKTKTNWGNLTCNATDAKNLTLVDKEDCILVNWSHTVSEIPNQATRRALGFRAAPLSGVRTTVKCFNGS